MARIAIGCVEHESSSFSSWTTGLQHFRERHGIIYGEPMLRDVPAGSATAGMVAAAAACGHEPVPLLAAGAETGGEVDVNAFAEILDDLCARIGRSGPLDGVCLELHGAMLLTDGRSGDLAIVEAVREVVGAGVPIGASFDLHGNISPALVESLDAAAMYRCYPHTDCAETGRRALLALDRRLRHGQRWLTAHRYLPFMFPGNRQLTSSGVFAEAQAMAQRLETGRDGVELVNVAAGYQLADIDSPMPSVFAYGSDPESVEDAVDGIVEYLCAHEASFSFDYLTAEQAAALAASYQGERPLVIADSHDNPGGGGSADVMSTLRALAAADVGGVMAGGIWDPAALARARRVGVGGRFSGGIGGTTVATDEPLQGTWEVVSISDEPIQHRGEMFGEFAMPVGGSAALRDDRGITLVVTGQRTQTFEPAMFTHHGLDPTEARVVVVKSEVHFRAEFERFAGRIVDVDGPGENVLDYSRLPFTRLRSGYRFFGNGPAARSNRASVS